MATEIRTIRRWLVFFMAALLASGLTAIPIDAELSLILQALDVKSDLYFWLNKVLTAVKDVKQNHGFLLYGYDWLAFAHIVLAILFVGPYRDPVKNIWVIEFGMIACMLVFPFAFIAGYFRGIPLGWQLIDCSFGLIGFIPLVICYKAVKILERPKLHSHISRAFVY